MSLNIFSVLMLILYRYPKVFFRERKQQKFIAVRKKPSIFKVWVQKKPQPPVVILDASEKKQTPLQNTQTRNVIFLPWCKICKIYGQYDFWAPIILTVTQSSNVTQPQDSFLCLNFYGCFLFVCFSPWPQTDIFLQSLEFHSNKTVKVWLS